MNTLQRAAGEEGTIVMVTHKLSLLNYVQRVILVVAGRVVLDGPTRAVLERLQVPQSAQPTAIAANSSGGAST